MDAGRGPALRELPLDAAAAMTTIHPIMRPPDDDTTYGRAFADPLLVQVRPVFEQLAADYAAAWGLEVSLVNPTGEVAVGPDHCHSSCRGGRACRATRARAVAESARWGQPHILLCPDGMMVWAVPVMQNARLLGGLVAAAPDHENGGAAWDTARVREAAEDLLQRAETANLTNAAQLRLQRQAARRESERAEAIQAAKDGHYRSIREIYLVEEPELIAAVKRGDRPAAREIINRLLTGIYFMGRRRPQLLKSFLLELVVVMSRSAVEAGADPAELLGANYSSFSDLARIEGEEKLTAWLVAMLERTMDAIVTHHRYPIGVLLSEAIRYMGEHLGDDISRDDIARRACLSPAHFSRVVKQTFGHSFTDLLARMRVDRARELLHLTEKPLAEISAECGFADQSYFTKVFQKHTGQTPREFRRSHPAEH
jgi:AraC-like DNA-binding protein/ligand-binding sensor protein